MDLEVDLKEGLACLFSLLVLFFFKDFLEMNTILDVGLDGCMCLSAFISFGY